MREFPTRAGPTFFRSVHTLDSPAYSLATEKMRAAFRVAYSILDKIGFFINDYFAMGTTR